MATAASTGQGLDLPVAVGVVVFIHSNIFIRTIAC